MRKRLSSGQKRFLRLYFPLIRGMCLLRSGLRFSFSARTESEEKATFVSEIVNFWDDATAISDVIMISKPSASPGKSVA